MNREINQYEGKSSYFETVNGDVFLNVPPSTSTPEQIIEKLKLASTDLTGYGNLFGSKIHIPRNETDKLYEWIQKPQEQNKQTIAVLAGNAGSGKSVILKDLAKRLIDENIPVLGLKADRLVVSGLKQLNEELLLNEPIEDLFVKITETQKIVLLVDQIDALSQSLSSDRKPIEIYHRLISRLSYHENVKVIVSCRLYDLDYDPILQEYRNKQIFRVSLLSKEEVENVLNQFDCDTNKLSANFINFLRTPIHLEIFCKITNKKEQKITNITNLYDTLWEEFIETKPPQMEVDSSKLVEFISWLANKMYKQQQISISNKALLSGYKKEIEYLKTNELIIDSNDKIQFVHQSFFDYAYARMFVTSEQSISKHIKEQHQGLFIRSKVKQVLLYLRDADEQLYIKEFEEILLGEYRFHIQLLILYELGFFSNPLENEKYFVKKHIIPNAELLKLFLEAVNSAKWFSFIIKELNATNYFKENNNEYINLIFVLCRKIIEKNADVVIDFLNQIPVEFQTKNHFIGKVLFTIPKEEIHKASPLFDATNKDWDRFIYYHFLRNSIDQSPDKVISELLKILDNYIIENENKATDIKIPHDHDGSTTYKDLYDKHKHLAVPFYIQVIQKIVSASKLMGAENIEEEIYGDTAYNYYVPISRHSYHNLHEQIYDFVLQYLDELQNSYFEKLKTIILPLSQSNLSSILNISIRYFIKQPELFIPEIWELFSRPDFFINYTGRNQFFTYQIKELLNVSYHIFSDDEKQILNKKILTAIPDYEKKQGTWGEKGISKWGYTPLGANQYQLLAAIPEIERQKYSEISEKYKEYSRKFGTTNNERPEGFVIKSGEIVMSESAYQNMNNEQWKAFFRKYVKKNEKWDGGTEIGHCRKFEDLVSKNPEKYITLIEECVEDLTIPQSYIVYGLQGLKKGNYSPFETRRLFVKCIKTRKGKLDSTPLLLLTWLTDYFINTGIINEDIISFITDLVKNHPDSEMLNNDPINDGINSVRGAACDRLVQCYKQQEFEEKIFSSLEEIADKAAVQTRAAALYQMAFLNKLNKVRNLDLYLKLMHDFNPLLLKIPLHNLHPLVYLIHVDFEKLIPFFEKAIEVEEGHEPISQILFIAWLWDIPNSPNLLDKISLKSIKAKQSIVKSAFDNITDKRFEDKCYEMITKFLTIDSKDLAQIYDTAFLRMKGYYNEKMQTFLEKYISSPIGKYREKYFYDYLLNITHKIPEKCIEWTLRFNEHVKPDYQQRSLQNEPLQVVILAYNAIKEYDKKNEYLEKAMDAFDEVLKIPEYRGVAFDVLRKLND